MRISLPPVDAARVILQLVDQIRKRFCGFSTFEPILYISHTVFLQEALEELCMFPDAEDRLVNHLNEFYKNSPCRALFLACYVFQSSWTK